jgi:hypothetical protein
MCGMPRTYATINAVKHIVTNKIPGDIIECGVYKGGQIMAMILTLLTYDIKNREIYLYDTFEGVPMPEPWEKAVKHGGSAVKRYKKFEREDGSSGWCRSELDEVKNNVLSLQYPEKRIHFIKGLVEDTLPKSNHKSVALLRLDTDLYSSTKTELEILYPKVPSNGVVIIDDYGHWSGSKKAVDEYINKNNLNVKLKVDDGTGRTIIKP